MFGCCSKTIAFLELIPKGRKWAVIELTLAVKFAEKAVAFPGPFLGLRRVFQPLFPELRSPCKIVDSEGNGPFARNLGNSDACSISKLTGPEKGLGSCACPRGIRPWTYLNSQWNYRRSTVGMKVPRNNWRKISCVYGQNQPLQTIIVENHLKILSS